MHFCPTCGAARSPNENYCAKCGYHFPDPIMIGQNTAGGMAAAVKRPVPMTVICIIGFLGSAVGLLKVLLAYSTLANRIGEWYPIYSAVFSVLVFICMLGLWNMKRWGIVTYTGLMILAQFILKNKGVWNIKALIIPGIIVVIGFLYYKFMD